MNESSRPVSTMRKKPAGNFVAILIFTWLTVLPGSSLADVADSISPIAVKLEDVLPLSEAGSDLAGKRVIYVGETHNAYQDHLVQLGLLKQFHHMHPDMAIGVEWFQKPFQSVLDDYITGRISEEAMLQKTEYFSRWGFDYRLYRPILRYARDNEIPVIALNAPVELVQAISSMGIEALPENLRTQLPSSYDFSSKDYRERLERAWNLHPDRNRKFQFFYEAQLTWDETMAESVTNHLAAYPQRNMIVFAGRGHIVNRQGIPSRVQRRIQLDDATVLTRYGGAVVPGMADYLVFAGRVDLPPQGKMGAFLADNEKGVRISALVPDSAAEKAGLKKNDIITAIDEQPVQTYAELKFRILDKKPGDSVTVTYLRKRWLLGVREKSIAFDLGVPQMTTHPPVHRQNNSDSGK